MIENKYPLVTVGGLIFANDQTILFVKSPKWGGIYALPGGKVELGETCEEAFRREVFEETGLKLINVRFAICQDSIFNKEYIRSNHFVMHDYIAEIDPDYSKESVVLNDEGTSYRFMTLEEARKEQLNKEAYILLDWYERMKTKTSVGFNHLEVECVIGNNPNEREALQKIFVTLKMNVPFDDSDRLADTIDYDEVSKLFQNEAKLKKFKLLEAYATHMKNCLKEKYKLKSFTITVFKPKALIHADNAFVEVKEGLI